jgi:predicted transcriptional regulator of viral defense system
MNRLVKAILQQVPAPVFTPLEISHLVSGSANTRYALVKRAIADGDILHIKRGLYTLSPLYRKHELNPLCVSQMIVTLSYISLETALSLHGWIPEAVRSITAVTSRFSTEFDTPVGHFTYDRVPQKTLFAGVERIQDTRYSVWFRATPLKALADYVYLHGHTWTSSHPLVESLRIEEESLREITEEDFLGLEGNYSNQRVTRFLEGLRKELFP